MYRHLASRAGDDSVKNPEERGKFNQLKKEHPELFKEGYLYPDAQILEYRPDKLLNPTTAIAAQKIDDTETLLNDCLALAVNRLVHWKFFVAREQIIRLQERKLHERKSFVEKGKIEYGSSIMAFKDFFVKDHRAYSLKEVATFAGEKGYLQLEAFVTENMIKNSKHRELLVLSTIFTTREHANHCTTFYMHQYNGKPCLFLYDPNQGDLYSRPRTDLCPYLDFAESFNRYTHFIVYYLYSRDLEVARKKTGHDEEYHLNNEMIYVMTGKWDEEYLKV